MAVILFALSYNDVGVYNNIVVKKSMKWMLLTNKN